MKYLPLRIWFLVSVAFAICGAIIRLAWVISYRPPAGTLTITILIILALIIFYALLAYLIIKPNLQKLKSLPVGIPFMVMATAGLVSGIIHFIRFVPSPEAAEPLSIVLAVLFLLAGISGYLLLLWVIWSIWRARKS